MNYSKIIGITLALLVLAGCENEEQNARILELEGGLQESQQALTAAQVEIERLNSLLEERIAAEARAEAARIVAEAQAEEARIAAEAQAEEARIAAEAQAEEARIAALNVQIEDECTVNGIGRVTCNFKNEGTGEGSICVQPFFRRVTFYEDNEFEMRYGMDPEIVSTGEICSGLVRPQDVVQRQTPMIFVGIENGRDVSPADYCNLSRTFGSWSDGCMFGTKKVED